MTCIVSNLHVTSGSEYKHISYSYLIYMELACCYATAHTTLHHVWAQTYKGNGQDYKISKSGNVYNQQKSLPHFKECLCFWFFEVHYYHNSLLYPPASAVANRGNHLPKLGTVQLHGHKGPYRAGHRPSRLLSDTSLLQQTSTIGLGIASSTSICQVCY